MCEKMHSVQFDSNVKFSARVDSDCEAKDRFIMEYSTDAEYYNIVNINGTSPFRIRESRNFKGGHFQQ